MPMNIELIPLIEITYYTSAPAPEHGPSWDHPQEWEQYARKRLKNAGFPDPFHPYKSGSSFYDPTLISPGNLRKLITDAFTIYDGTNLDEILPFYGGYLLRVEGKDILYPQCCGDLGDIVYWEKLIFESKVCYLNGHPAPLVKFVDQVAIFTFDESDESFSPPTVRSIELECYALKDAFQQAWDKLAVFAQQIAQLELEMDIDLQGENMANILIYRNQEISD